MNVHDAILIGLYGAAAAGMLATWQKARKQSSTANVPVPIDKKRRD